MDVRDVLIELFDRIPEHVEQAVTGLSAAALATEPEPGSNTVGWLVWHLIRVQDNHVAELLDAEEVWVTGRWAPRFGLPADARDTGYGHSHAQMAAVRPEGPEVLVGYYQAVAGRTRDYLRGLTAADLDRVIDARWDPPVTMGVRLVSVADDNIQHAGQAKYVRGMLSRRDVT